VPVVISCSGRVTDKNDNQPLPGSRVLLRLEGKTVDSTLTDEKGIYKFTNLKQKTGYNVKAEKEGYFADSKDFTTKAEKFSTEYSGKNGYELDLSLMKITKEEIVIDNIYYDFDKWDLRPESFIELDKLVKLLTESPKVKIVINSHTDERGKPDYNLKLSEKRAESVVNYLISRGISAERLSSKGYGATMPLIKNAKDDDEHQKNRRTTFKVVEK
jgi:outer membrane protein OmpA-like peptidoglycan-associated protein